MLKLKSYCFILFLNYNSIFNVTNLFLTQFCITQ